MLQFSFRSGSSPRQVMASRILIYVWASFLTLPTVKNEIPKGPSEERMPELIDTAETSARLYSGPSGPSSNWYGGSGYGGNQYSGSGYSGSGFSGYSGNGFSGNGGYRPYYPSNGYSNFGSLSGGGTGYNNYNGYGSNYYPTYNQGSSYPSYGYGSSYPSYNSGGYGGVGNYPSTNYLGGMYGNGYSNTGGYGSTGYGYNSGFGSYGSSGNSGYGSYNPSYGKTYYGTSSYSRNPYGSVY